jgi:glutathione synthase/RimK-type ligase-like ATP-grasp enzyme
MKKTLLIIGDECDYESFKKVRRNTNKDKAFNYLWINYDKLFSKQLPEIETEEIIIYLFFPFNYWDKYIEPKNYKGVYGSGKFFNRFKEACKKIEKIINQKYKDKIIHYIIPADMMYQDRDKELTKEILKKAKVQVPKTIKSRDIKKIKNILKKTNLFIKVRYGAMGKGITYLKKDAWKTNFRFKNGKIKSKKSDYGWTFIDITNNDNFLKQLLKEDITIEEEIQPYIVDKKKFDLRIYVSFNQIRYIYPRTNKSFSVTTNISQGGKGESQLFLNKIPKKLLNQAKKEAINAAIAMKTNFAGVDVMFDGKKNKPFVIEIQAFPGFPGSKRFNISKRILKDIKHHFN